MVHKEIHGSELYVYMNGSLLYKRWFDYGHGIIFPDDKGRGLGQAQGPYRASDVWQHVNQNTHDSKSSTVTIQ